LEARGNTGRKELTQFPLDKSLTRAKKRGPDAHDRASLGNGGLKIAAHSHRELAEAGARRGREAVADRPQVRESPPRDIGIFGKRRDGHQAVDSDMRARERRVEKPRRLVRLDPGLRWVKSGVDLKQNGLGLARLGGDPVQNIEKLRAVDALDPVEVPDRQTRLVRLKVPDELPGDGDRCLRPLVDSFLDAVLAHGPQSVASRKLHRSRRMRFSDREKFNFTGVPVRRRACPSYP